MESKVDLRMEIKVEEGVETEGLGGWRLK